MKLLLPYRTWIWYVSQTNDDLPSLKQQDPLGRNLTSVSLRVFPTEHGWDSAVELSAPGDGAASRKRSEDGVAMM